MVKSEQVILGAGVLGLGYLLLKGSTLPGGGGGDDIPPPGGGIGGGGSIIEPDPDLPDDAVPVVPDPSFPPGSPENPLMPDDPIGNIIDIKDWYDIKDIGGILGWSRDEYRNRWDAWYKARYMDRTGKVGGLTWQELYAFNYSTTVERAKKRAGFANLRRSLGWKNVYVPVTNTGKTWGEWWTPPGWPNNASVPLSTRCRMVAKDDPYTGSVYDSIVASKGEQYVDVWNTAWMELSAYDWDGTSWVRVGCLNDPGDDSGTEPPPGDTNLAVDIVDVAVSKATAQRGETVVISVTVSNPNSTSKSFSVQFSGELTNATINNTLAGLETKTYSFNRNVNFEGTKSATLGGFTISITGVVETGSMPVEISNLRASADEANQGERVDISYDVYNPNNISVNWNAQFSGSLTTAYRSGILGPQQTQTITISRLINFEGTKSATLAGMTVSITGLPEEPYEPPSNSKETVKDVDYYASVSPWGTSWCCMVCNTCFATESEVKQHIKNTGHYA